MKILVVHNLALMRAGLRNVVAELGQQVTALEAADGTAALNAAERNLDLDLVLLDITLPDMHGLGLLDTLHERHPTVPLVLVSARDDDHTAVIEALKHGASGYIPRAASKADMVAALREVLAGAAAVPRPRKH